MFERSDLHPYQRSAGEFIASRQKCGLFIEMGLGKTVVSITSVLDMLDDFYINSTLVIAPLRVANHVWTKEAQDWAHTKGLKLNVCTGSPEERMKALKADADIHIINRENVPWLIKNVRWKWDKLVIDESSSFKSPKTKRFKALKVIVKYLKCVILLSGTPSPNGMLDLWPQLYFIDQGKRLGRTISEYRKKYFFLPPHSEFKYELKEGAYEEIMAKISDVCMSMSADDYLELPACIYLDEWIDMPLSARRQYDELEKEFILNIAKGIDIEAPSQGVLLNKLLQLCNGAIYDADKVAHVVHDEKLLRLRELMDENPNENFLVAYNFKSDLKRIKEAFPEAVALSRSGVELDEWNKGNIKMLLAHPASAGHGLNMQYGGSVIIWFGMNWSLELYLQFNARLHRQGQKKPVRIIHLVMNNAADGKVAQAIRHKSDSQSSVLKYLKHAIVDGDDDDEL